MWVKNNTGNENIKEGKYWVNTPKHGVVMATFHHWGNKFQSTAGNDEGMCGFEVTHYQAIAKPEPPQSA